MLFTLCLLSNISAKELKIKGCTSDSEKFNLANLKNTQNNFEKLVAFEVEKGE